MAGCVVYIRVSTEEQVANLSLDTQDAACRAYAARQGWDVLRVYREEGESAKTAQRPVLQRLLADLERRRFRPVALVVYDLSRLARETLDHLLIRRQLRDLGIVLRAATQPVDETPEGELLETMLAAIARWDNAARSRRVLAGMRAAAERGRWVWVAPRGYRHRGPGGGLEPDPDTAPIVRRSFERIASGAWTVEGARAEAEREGLKVSRTRWYALLRSAVYLGRVVSPAWGIDVAGEHEPLVDAATWHAAQKSLTARLVKRRYVAGGTELHPLKGIVRCFCGRPLTGDRAKSRGYYRCPHGGHASGSADRLHGAFRALLAREACPPELVTLLEETIAARFEAGAGERAANAARARHRLERLGAARQRLLDLLTDGVLDPDDYRRQNARLAAERQRAEAEIASMEGAAELSLIDVLRAGRGLLTRPAETWEALPASRRPPFAQAIYPDGLEWDGTKLSNSGKCLLRLPLAGDSGEVVPLGTPNGIRTRVAALKGQCPRPG